MYETTVTMVGRLATAVTQVTFDDGGVKASFRLASTERRFDRGLQQWVDGARLFLTVVCWRALAERVVDTLRTGDPVIVRGRLRSREYEKDGQAHSVIEIEAASIGPDLARCSAVVARRAATAGGQREGSPSAPDEVEQNGHQPSEERSLDEAAVGV
jgi:single-strand DNA-binding protein